MCLDPLMNIVLEQCEEYINGVKKHEFDELFIRGNNGKAIYYKIYIFSFIFKCN